MILFRPYVNIKNFLNRFTILKIGSLHIRLHWILDSDKSTLYHNHPFHYISIILKGGYVESYIVDSVTKIAYHKFGSIIIRKNSIFHRIDKILGETLTLFIAYGNYGWQAHNTIVDTSGDGLFERIVNNKKIWSKKENGIWFIGNEDKNIAQKETRHSVHQIL